MYRMTNIRDVDRFSVHVTPQVGCRERTNRVAWRVVVVGVNIYCRDGRGGGFDGGGSDVSAGVRGRAILCLDRGVVFQRSTVRYRKVHDLG